MCVCARSCVERAHGSYLHGSYWKHRATDCRDDTQINAHSVLRCATGAEGHMWAMFYYRRGLEISPGLSKHRAQRLWLHRGAGGQKYGSFSLKHHLNRTDGRGLLTGILTLSLTRESNCLGCLATGPELALDPLTPCQSVSICFLLFSQK